MLILGYSLTSWLLSVLLCAVAILYLKARKQLRYFKDRRIPGPEPMYLFGNLWGTWRKPIKDIDVEYKKKYGHILGTFEGHTPTLHITDPELVRKVLVKDFDHFMERRYIPSFFPEDSIILKSLTIVTGDEWRGIRQLVSPAFSTLKMKKMVELMDDCAKNMVNHFKKKQKEERVMNVKDIYGSFIIDTIAICAFGTKVDSVGKADDPFVTHSKEFLNFDTLESPAVIISYILPDFFLRKVASGVQKIFGKACDFFEKVIDNIFDMRKGKPSARGDFLDVLLEEKVKANEPSGDLPLKQKVATNRVIKAQSILFFLAGYDTTANLMTMMSYELAKHPDIQEKVYQEIHTKLNKHGGFTYEMITDLTYMDMVMSETVRKSANVVRLERVCTKAIEYDGLKIPEGMIVKIPVHPIHLDEQIYPEPDKFIPERFTPEAKSARSPYSFLSFGQGPRNCVGMRFALEEAKVGMAHLLHEVKFHTIPETKVEFLKGFPANIPKNVLLGAELRDST